MSDTSPFESERRAMVNWQLASRGVRDARVLDAMAHVPRHEFVPEAYQQAAYDDCPIGIGDGQTVSQPYIVAAMTEAAQIEPGNKVLEIGTGSGYQAAVLAYLGAKVITVERNKCLAERARVRFTTLAFQDIQVVVADGSLGHPPGGPYDAVLVTAAAPRVPQALFDQLAEGGRLVIPVGSLQHQVLQLIRKQGGRRLECDLDPCQFVPLVGAEAWPEGTR